MFLLGPPLYFGGLFFPTCPLVFFFPALVHCLLVSPVSCSLHVYTSTLSLDPCFAAFSHYVMFTSYVRPGCSSCWPFCLFIACLVGCLLAIFVFDHQSRRPTGHHQSYLLLDLLQLFIFLGPPWTCLSSMIIALKTENMAQQLQLHLQPLF